MSGPGEFCIFRDDPRDPVAQAEIRFRDARDDEQARRAGQPEPTRVAQAIIDWYEQNKDTGLGRGFWAVDRLYDNRTTLEIGGKCFLTASQRLENFCQSATSENRLLVRGKLIAPIDLNLVTIPGIDSLATYCVPLIVSFDFFSLSLDMALLEAHWGVKPYYVPEALKDGLVVARDYPRLYTSPKIFGRHIDDGRPFWRRAIEIAARGGRSDSIDTPDEVKAFRRDVYEPAWLEDYMRDHATPEGIALVFHNALIHRDGKIARDSLASLTNAVRETRALDQVVFEMIMDQMEIPDNTYIANLLQGPLASVNFDLLGSTTLDYYNARIRDVRIGARDQKDAHLVMTTIENMRRALRLLQDKATRKRVQAWLAKLEKLDLDHFDIVGNTYQRHNPLEVEPPKVPAPAPGGCGAGLGARP